MSNLRKARIHSVDSDGTIIEDVDVYTSGDAVTLNNGKTLESIYENEIGNVNQLNTDNKAIVDAINENTYNLAGVASQVKTISDNIESSVVAAPSVSYGMNNVITNTGRVSLLPKFTIQGKTIINIFGGDGNCEDISKWLTYQLTPTLDNTNKVFGNNGFKLTTTSTFGSLYNLISKYNIDITKYYLLSAYIKNGNASFISVYKDTVGGGTQVSAQSSDATKFIRVGVVIKPSDFNAGNAICIGVNGAAGQYAYVDGIMINEITASEYALGANALLYTYPYVDSYSCLQNPYIEVRHDNLVRNGNGEEGTAWWLNSGLGISSEFNLVNSKFQLSATTNDSRHSQSINVKPNTNYYFNCNITGGTSPYSRVYDSSWGSMLLSGNGTFNSGNNSSIFITFACANGSTMNIDSIMLVEGTTVPSSYKTCRIERCVLETKLTSDDSIVYDNGEVSGQIWWKHKTLFGKDYDWQFSSDYTGYKTISLLNTTLSGINSIGTLSKYDGKIVQQVATISTSDSVIIQGSAGAEYLSLADADTGFAESINPNNDEVKAFMNGWKSVYVNNSNRYVFWVSVIDGSVPSGAISTTVASQSSSTVIVVGDGTKFAINDYIAVYSTSWIVAQITGISGNTLTLGSPVGTVILEKGAYKADSGTTNTSLLNWCKNNVAPGYEGYQLHYKLQNPEPTTDINCHVHGDIPKFDVGDNYLYLDSGIVLGEVANPIYDGTTNYCFNTISWDSLKPSKFRNKTESINIIYKNSLVEDMTLYVIRNSYMRDSYGNCDAFIGKSYFDSSATYTVDYKILATQAPQVGSIICSYGQDIIGSINSIEESLNNKQNQNSILDSIVDLSLYEILSFSAIHMNWVYTDSIYAQIIVPYSLKKVIPIIGVSDVTIYSGGTIITDKCSLVTASASKNRVEIKYRITDTTVITSIKNNGIYCKITLIADCRGRV